MQNNIIKQEPKANDNSLIKTGNFSYFLSSESVKQKINEVIGGKEGQAFITNICSAVANNSELAKCENWSIVLSALQGAALKLSPQLQQYYLIPFNDKTKDLRQAQFQIGYKGYIQLAIRSAQYKNINVIELKEGEVVNYNRLTEKIETKFIEDDELREKTPTTGYYASIETINGFTKTIYWTKKKMLAHAKKYSQAYRYDLQKGYTNSIWSKDFDIMALKTLIKQLIGKWGIMSVELQDAYTKDGASFNEDGFDYIDNPEEIPQTEPLKPVEELKPINDSKQTIETQTIEEIEEFNLFE